MLSEAGERSYIHLKVSAMIGDKYYVYYGKMKQGPTCAWKCTDLQYGVCSVCAILFTVGLLGCATHSTCSSMPFLAHPNFEWVWVLKLVSQGCHRQEYIPPVTCRFAVRNSECRNPLDFSN